MKEQGGGEVGWVGRREGERWMGLMSQRLTLVDDNDGVVSSHCRQAFLRHSLTLRGSEALIAQRRTLQSPPWTMPPRHSPELPISTSILSPRASVLPPRAVQTTSSTFPALAPASAGSSVTAAAKVNAAKVTQWLRKTLTGMAYS